MNTQTDRQPAAPPAADRPMPKGLFVFSLLYGGMAVLAGFLAYKQVQLPFTNLAVEAGIFAFLFLVVISSTVAQRYGEAVAKRMVWWGFLPLAVSAVLIFLVLALPASPEMLEFRSADLAAFETVLSQTPRIMAAGPVAYLVSLLLNVWLFSKLRGDGSGDGNTQGSTGGLMIRGGIASALSQAVDSLIFVTLAFYGEFDITNLLIGQVIAKVVLSLVLVPPLIALAVKVSHKLDEKPG